MVWKKGLFILGMIIAVTVAGCSGRAQQTDPVPAEESGAGALEESGADVGKEKAGAGTAGRLSEEPESKAAEAGPGGTEPEPQELGPQEHSVLREEERAAYVDLSGVSGNLFTILQAAMETWTAQAELDVEYDIADMESESSVARQLQDINGSLNKGIAVLGVAPVEAEPLEEMVFAAKEAGVSLLGIYTTLPDESGEWMDAKVYADEYAAGQMAAERMFEEIAELVPQKAAEEEDEDHIAGVEGKEDAAGVEGKEGAAGGEGKKSAAGAEDKEGTAGAEEKEGTAGGEGNKRAAGEESSDTEKKRSGSMSENAGQEKGQEKDQGETEEVRDPVRVGVLALNTSHDALLSRNRGFVERLTELIQADGGNVSITGARGWTQRERDPQLIIEVVFSEVLAENPAQDGEKLLKKADTVGIFAGDKNSAEALLMNENTRTVIEERDISVIAVGAGETVVSAVQAGIFTGGITPDAVRIGEEAGRLLEAMMRGERVKDVVVESVWYTKENMRDAGIVGNLYE